MNGITFVTHCFGEKYLPQAFHLLNDFRNLNVNVVFLTNMDVDLERWQYSNVKLVKTNNEWTDFERYKAIKYAMETTNDEFIYWVESDSRLFNAGIYKFDEAKLTETLKKKKFDIITSCFLSETIEWHLKTPEPYAPNKRERCYSFGYDSVINYLKQKHGNYDLILNKKSALEPVLIFRKSEKILHFLNEMIEFGELVAQEDAKNGRDQKATSSSFAITFFSDMLGLELVQDSISYHY